MPDHTGQGRHCGIGRVGGQLITDRRGSSPQNMGYDQRREVERVQDTEHVAGIFREQFTATAALDAGLDPGLMPGEDLGGGREDPVVCRGRAGDDSCRAQAAALSVAALMAGASSTATS